jgi:hypothetical protein
MNNIVYEMGTLICYTNKWTTKLGKNMVIEEPRNNNNYISS